ncbi:YolD-like family protein [Bacillus marinisedimentorum]|uniref:YolD-like family protein n=1 Tax=Bacillus marinisedimentorum TaxID=1821260 RepID=UPI0008731EEE|nr:YolD-like family protein [Bacillus marinisedimentorum]
MLKDRGNIKWTSLMLPEHVGKLRRWEKEDQRPQKPELDEQELELLDEMITEALSLQKPLTFTVFEKSGLYQATGRITRIDQIGGLLHLTGAEGSKRQTIQLGDILKAEWPVL